MRLFVSSFSMILFLVLSSCSSNERTSSAQDFSTGSGNRSDVHYVFKGMLMSRSPESLWDAGAFVLWITEEESQIKSAVIEFEGRVVHTDIFTARCPNCYMIKSQENELSNLKIVLENKKIKSIKEDTSNLDYTYITVNKLDNQFKGVLGYNDSWSNYTVRIQDNNTAEWTLSGAVTGENGPTFSDDALINLTKDQDNQSFDSFINSNLNIESETQVEVTLSQNKSTIREIKYSDIVFFRQFGNL